MLAHEVQTFAATVSVCETCGEEIGYVEARLGSPGVLRPCGHDVKILLRANPKLPKV